MKCLVVVDMQNDFISGSLGTKEAESIVPKVADKIQAVLENKDHIFFTIDTHDEDYLSTLEGKNLPIIHCKRGTEGWKIGKEVISSNLLNSPYVHVVEKKGFGSLELSKVINEVISPFKKVEEIELIGICTDICVIVNAMIIKSAFPNVKVVVDASCCAGSTKEQHINALQTMKNCQIEVKNETYFQHIKN